MNVFLFHLQWFTEVDSYIIQKVFLLYNLLTHQSILTIIIFPSIPDLEVQLLKWRPLTGVGLSSNPTLIVFHPSLDRFSLNVCSAATRVNRQMKRSITLRGEVKGWPRTVEWVWPGEGEMMGQWAFSGFPVSPLSPSFLPLV